MSARPRRTAGTAAAASGDATTIAARARRLDSYRCGGGGGGDCQTRTGERLSHIFMLGTRTSAPRADPRKPSFQGFRARRCATPRRSKGRVGMPGRRPRRVSGSRCGPPILSGFRPTVESQASGRHRFRKRKYMAVFARSVFLVCAVDVVVAIRSRLQHLRIVVGH